MTFDGRKLYEVFDRKTGRMLASGSVKDCAKKLQLTPSGFRLAASNEQHKKYCIRHVATMRKIYSVYDEHGTLISRGSLRKVAEEMNYAKGTVEYWGRVGQVNGLTITITEEVEHTDAAREDIRKVEKI